MPIKFVPEQNNLILIDCEVELNFKILGINNPFIYSTKYIQIKNNKLIFLNKNKKLLGDIHFESEERAINFFNMITFLSGYKIIFKDKFAVKED